MEMADLPPAFLQKPAPHKDCGEPVSNRTKRAPENITVSAEIFFEGAIKSGFQSCQRRGLKPMKSA